MNGKHAVKKKGSGVTRLAWGACAVVLAAVVIAVPVGFAISANGEGGGTFPLMAFSAAEGEQDFFSNRGQAQAAGEKQETVRVRADAYGVPKEVSVSDTLRQLGDAAYVMDRSNLAGIVNTQGDEDFSQHGTELLWQNKGRDISYEGNSSAELPVAVKVSYYLDGKEISPEEIAGKSGSVRIRFDYAQSTEQQPVYAFVTMVLFDHERFTDVRVLNGRNVSMGDDELVCGYAIPYLKEALGLSRIDGAEGLEVPSYLEISAQATDFQLDYTTTLATSGLFKDVQTDKLQESEDLVKSIHELDAASSQILSALTSLDAGADAFGGALAQYTDGVHQLDEGINAFTASATAAQAGNEDLVKGAKQLACVLRALDEALRALGTEDLTKVCEKIHEVLPLLECVSSTDLGALERFLDDLDNLQLELGKITSTIESCTVTLDVLRQELATIEVEILSLREQGVDTASLEVHLSIAYEEIDEVAISLAGIELPQPSCDIEPLREAVTAQCELAQKLEELVSSLEGCSLLGEATKQLEELKCGTTLFAKGASELEQGIALYESGMAALNNGLDELDAGSDLLDSRGDDLRQGYGILSQGVATLLEQYRVFDQEGIDKLAELASDDVIDVFERIRELKYLDEYPKSFSGNADGTSSSVTFLIETDAVGAS